MTTSLSNHLTKILIGCKNVPFFALDNGGNHQAKAHGLGRVSVTQTRPCAFAWRSLDYPSAEKGTFLQSRGWVIHEILYKGDGHSVHGILQHYQV